jgi:hypothetical protein
MNTGPFDGFALGGPAVATLAPPPPPPGAPARDDHVMDAVAAALAATGAFDEVVQVHAEPGEFAVGADRYAVAWAWQTDGAEPDAGSDAAVVCREVGFTVAIAVRQEEPAGRGRALRRLEAACLNAINGHSLAGLTLPALTRLRRAAPGRAAAPGGRIDLTGRTAYLDDAGYDPAATDSW